MYRFLQKSVIGLVLGVLAFSPLVFSLQNNLPVVEVATASAADCTVVKAQFDKGNNSGDVNSYASIYGSDATASFVQLSIWTQDCVGKKLAVKLWEQNDVDGEVHLDGTAKQKNFQTFDIPDTGAIALNFKVGEEYCNVDNPECRMYAKIYESDTSGSLGSQIFTTEDKESQKGMLFYNCRGDNGENEGDCDSLWQYKDSQKITTPPPADTWYYKSAQDNLYYLAVGATTKEQCTTYSGTKNNGQSTECTTTPPSQLISEGQVAQVSPESSMPKCWLGTFDGGISVSGCFAQILYYVFYIPTSWLFMIAGMLFDYTFDYSIQSTSYNNNFISQAWSLVRDLCNILFIAIMMYIAIGTLLNTSGVDWKKMILPVIVIAVLINFSFFFTRVIIDFGNVTARLFYNSDTISITKKVDGKDVVSHGMSETIVSGFDPQRIVLEGKDRLYSDTNQTVQPAEDTSNSTFILITICAVILNVIGAGIFFKIAVLFIGRVIGLWVQIIKSPMAFMSHALPKGWKLGSGNDFNSWLTETFKASFMATIFMVFMYMILLFVQVISKSQGSFFNGNMAWILGIVMPFIFIIEMMKMAQETATKWAGDVARQLAGKITQAAGVVGGLALGAATGGAALIGRNTIGAFANSGTGAKMAERLAAREAKGGIMGKMAGLGLKTFDKAKDGSFDARNTKGFNAVSGGFSKVSGFDMSGKSTNAFLGNAGLSMGSVGLDAKKTGFATYQKERQEKREKEIERQSKVSHVTDTQFKEMHDKKVEKYEKIYKEKLETEKLAANYAAKTDEEKKKFEEEFKKKHEAKYGKRFETLGKDAKPEDIKAMRKKVEDERLEKLLARLDTRFDDFSVTGSVLNKVTSFVDRSKNKDRNTKGVVATGVVGTATSVAGVMTGSALMGTGVGVVAGAALVGGAIADSRINKDIKEKYAKQKEKAAADAIKLQNQNEDLERINKENERRITAAESALARNTGLIENNALLKPLKDKIEDLKNNNEEYKKIVDEKKAILAEEDEINKKLGKKRDATTGKFVDMTDADKQAIDFTELSDDEKKKAKKSAEDMAKNIIRKEKQLQDMITTTVEDYVFEQNEKLRDELYQKEQSGTVDKKELDKIRSRMKFLGSVSSDRKNFSRQKETLTTQIDSNKAKIKENKEKIESGGKPKEEKK